jgi:radical SAM superfamily enzyme YgiQ (UPF0313 family)
MREVSRTIIGEGVDIQWWCMARLDPGFTKELFETARRAGLVKINFGFESASDKVCRLLDKGNLRERSVRVIRDCAEAGIQVDLQTIFGLPGETFEDGLETVDFLIRNKRYISHVTFNSYYLTPANFVYQAPEKYGIAAEKDPALPFCFFVPFKNDKGMTQQEAQLLQKIFYSLSDRSGRACAEPGEGGAAASSEDACPGWADLTLNGESARVRYFYRKESDEYLFMDRDAPEINGGRSGSHDAGPCVEVSSVLGEAA